MDSSTRTLLGGIAIAAAVFVVTRACGPEARDEVVKPGGTPTPVSAEGAADEPTPLVLRDEKPSDACREPYHWREATPEDHVCVLLEVRLQAAEDNLNADKRRKGDGSDACKPEFVWREARPGDHVCVTRDTRAQVMQDNRREKFRVATFPTVPPA